MASSSARVTARLALILTAILLLTRVWFVTHRALDLDEFEHAHAAWSVSRGLLPYRDFFEHHPPALYLLSAPLFADPHAATEPAAAMHVLIAARIAMWLLTIGSVTIVHRLGAGLHGPLAGALATVLLATSSQFVESMLEFRPDVPAVLCLLAAVWCLAGIDDRDAAPRPQVRALAAGIAFGGALLCTQKAMFAAPGIGLALLARRRAAPVALFAAGVAAPIAITAGWFATRGAAQPLWYYTVTLQSRLNAERFSPLPRMLSDLIQQPAIYVLGVGGLIAGRLKPDITTVAPVDSGLSRIVIRGTALSLIAGIFVIGKAYDQYYALLLPLLAVLGGGLAADLCGALNLRPAATATMMIALAVLSLGVSGRAFTPIAPQAADIALVTARTAPDAAYLGGSPAAALFRPHAWFYFFLTGAFAAPSDYAALLAELESGALRPALVVRDRYFEQHAPAPLLAFVDAHYRRLRGDLYLRQSEYGSSTLKTSEASDRFDRPLTR